VADLFHAGLRNAPAMELLYDSHHGRAHNIFFIIYLKIVNN
jgi:hypothetical protein